MYIIPLVSCFRKLRCLKGYNPEVSCWLSIAYNAVPDSLSPLFGFVIVTAYQRLNGANNKTALSTEICLSHILKDPVFSRTEKRGEYYGV